MITKIEYNWITIWDWKSKLVNIDEDNLPEITTDSYDVFWSDWRKLLQSNYWQKSFQIEGRIEADDKNDLYNIIEDYKRKLSSNEELLRLYYDSWDVRAAKAICTNPNSIFDTQSTTIDYIEFTITFTVYWGLLYDVWYKQFSKMFYSNGSFPKSNLNYQWHQPNWFALIFHVQNPWNIENIQISSNDDTLIIQDVNFDNSDYLVWTEARKTVKFWWSYDDFEDFLEKWSAVEAYWKYPKIFLGDIDIEFLDSNGNNASWYSMLGVLAFKNAYK